MKGKGGCHVSADELLELSVPAPDMTKEWAVGRADSDSCRLLPELQMPWVAAGGWGLASRGLC